MVHLHTHVRWCTRAQWAMGGLLVAILLIFYAIGYRPETRKLQELNASISREQMELSDNQYRTRQLPIIAAQVRQLRERTDPSKQLPPHQELPQFLKAITALGQQSDLHNFTIKPGTESRSDLFSAKPISLTFDGDFLAVFSFLQHAEDMQRMTRIGTMSIKNKDGDAGKVQVQLSMNIYFAPD